MKNELQNSIEYLKKKSGESPGFSVPPDYFETVEASFSNKLKENNFVKEKGFEVPDSYFNKLEDCILSKVSPTNREVQVISLKKRISKLIPIAAAASIALFIGLNSFIFNKTSENSLDKLTDSDVENWIANNINLIDINDFTITHSDVEFDEYLSIPNSISNNELENYLNHQENILQILEND
tara:strand:- start:3026 stop:3571 length:546 start_codon:yes stop_codon:yes gene_type:complete